MMKFFGKILLFLIMGIGAAAADLYTVTGIPIAAEEASAQQARTVAIQNGETVAFQNLMDKMVADGDRPQVMMPTEAEILNMVQHVSLAAEKYTATKYMAHLTVRFHPEKVQEFLKGQHIPFLMEEMPAVVLIPVIRQGEEFAVLEENNSLYAYLKSDDFNNEGLVVVPTGDLEDMMWARQIAESQDVSAERELADKYGVHQVMILDVNREAPDYIRIKMILSPENAGIVPPDYILSQETEQEPDWADVWTRIWGEWKQIWKAAKTNDLNMPDSFWIQVPIRHLSEWVSIQKQLAKADFLESMQVYGFRPNMVFLSVQYKGAVGALQKQLNDKGFDLNNGDFPQVWVLTRRGS